MIKNQIGFMLFLLVLASSCKGNLLKNNQMSIKWNKILNTQKEVSFAQVDFAHDRYIVSYSYYSAIGGGFKIIEVKIDSSITLAKVLLEQPSHTIGWVRVKDTNIGFVKIDFEKNTLNSTLLKSNDLGQHWDTVQAPQQLSIRRFEFLPSSLVIEGEFEGANYIYKSDNEVNWILINAFKLGYKDIYLLQSSENGNGIFCGVNKTYNYKKDMLALINLENGAINELLKINTQNSFITPICKNKNLFAIINDRKISIYTYQNELFSLEHKFNIPNGTNDAVKNLYMNEHLYIITCRKKGITGKTLSWISYNQGADWEPFEHNTELKLVFNTLGELWVIDNNNNLLQGNVAIYQTDNVPNELVK